MSNRNNYYAATCHPWPCLLFLMPLLVLYEIGVVHFGGEQSDLLRNGADHWLRQFLGITGLKQMVFIPIALLLFLGIWSYRRRSDRPKDLRNILPGMTIESLAYALGLWGISRSLGPLIEGLGLAVNETSYTPLEQLVTYIGAGIYEEALFRLVLFSGLLWFFRKAEVPLAMALAVAALASATLFSGAHHLGPQGEPFDPYTFLFRSIAGLYFALLYYFRGFGIAVGAHAGYDIAVGIVLQN